METAFRDVSAADDARAVLDATSVSDPQSAASITHDSSITPELNALDVTPLDGIRERKVKELCLEVSYSRASEQIVKRIREILETYPGEIPISVALTEVPAEVRERLSNGEKVKIRINGHFRVQPGPQLSAAIQSLDANLIYSF
jgi:hypothetical protein